MSRPQLYRTYARDDTTRVSLSLLRSSPHLAPCRPACNDTRGSLESASPEQLKAWCGSMHPEYRRRTPTAYLLLRLVFAFAALSWFVTLVWWVLHVDSNHGRPPPSRRGLGRPLPLDTPPPAPDDAVSRAWRLRNEVLTVEEHERKE